jgi:hypothetical protein
MSPEDLGHAGSSTGISPPGRVSARAAKNVLHGAVRCTAGIISHTRDPGPGGLRGGESGAHHPADGDRERGSSDAIHHSPPRVWLWGESYCAAGVVSATDGGHSGRPDNSASIRVAYVDCARKRRRTTRCVSIVREPCRCQPHPVRREAVATDVDAIAISRSTAACPVAARRLPDKRR